MIPEQLTEQQQAFLKMVEKHLRDARLARSGAEMNFKAQLSDGNIRDSWVETKVKARIN